VSSGVFGRGRAADERAPQRHVHDIAGAQAAAPGSEALPRTLCISKTCAQGRFVPRHAASARMLMKHVQALGLAHELAEPKHCRS